MTLITENLKNELSNCKTIEDLMGQNGLMKRMLKEMVEHMMDAEMKNHLGYDKNERIVGKGKNYRNGKKSKNVRSSFGEIDVNVPQDRLSEFEPQIVPKYKRDITLFDDKIISMYGKGMSTRDITEHLKEMYGVDISPTLISDVTESVIHLAQEWQNRPLSKIYAIVYFDAIFFKIKDDHKIIIKAAYSVLGIDLEGKKEVLGIWINETEGSKFWLKVCTDLKNRGVQDILIASIDGLKGLPDAIKSVFPKVEIQLCIVHMIRNSMKFVASKYTKEFCRDLKKIYTAPNESDAQIQLSSLIDKWNDKYPLSVKPWINNWDNITTFFRFSPEIRRIMYTTNAVESLHRQFRKIAKAKTIFPSDSSLIKLLFLASSDLAKKWTQPIPNWASIISQLVIHFEGRLDI